MIVFPPEIQNDRLRINPLNVQSNPIYHCWHY